MSKKSRNSDTLGPVELIVWPKQGNQGDWHEQDDQGEVSIIIFGMSKSSGFQKYSICWVFQALCLCLCLCHCLCHCIVFVFVFVSSYDFLIAFIISFQNMYGYRGLWSPRAEILTIFEVLTDKHRHIDSPIPLINLAHPVGYPFFYQALFILSLEIYLEKLDTDIICVLFFLLQIILKIRGLEENVSEISGCS